MDLLAGAARGTEAKAVERLMLEQLWVPVTPGLDYLAAINTFQAARGRQPPAPFLQDCLIAALALQLRGAGRPSGR